MSMKRWPMLATFLLCIGAAAPDTSLRDSLKGMVFKSLPRFNERDLALANLGRKLFFDTRFSRNGKVSCATCHQPALAFTDGLVVASGIAQTRKNTPTIINTFSDTWFFWDGRADSLEAQALGPLEAAAEHGLKRDDVARLLNENYADEYKQLFGSLPPSPPESDSDDEQEAKRHVAIAEVVARYAVDTIPMKLKRSLINNGIGNFTPAHTIFLDQDVAYAGPPQRLGPSPAVDEAFVNFGRAVAAYERGIVAADSPFDRYAARVLAGSGPQEALGDGFGTAELAGLQLFLGKAHCSLCHNGPNFTDQQFHNTGMPQTEPPFDLGRAEGLVIARQTSFNCLGGVLPKNTTQSCLQLPYLDNQAVETVGAFKTPTLRNVALTAPYGHDGRFPTLMDILNHYNELKVDPSLGHREETLKPLGLTPNDLHNLEAFLKSLTSPIRDLTGNP